MKTLAIMGSHRKNGYTKDVLNYFIQALSPAEKPTVLDVNQLTVADCRACDYCVPHQGKCVIDDDMTAVYEELITSDLIIIASPVYFSAFPAKFKRMIDRNQMLFNWQDRSAIQKKDMVYIGLGGSRPYPHQFLGAKVTLEWYTKIINGVMQGWVEIPNTDRVPPLADSQVTRNLDQLAEQIKKN